MQDDARDDGPDAADRTPSTCMAVHRLPSAHRARTPSTSVTWCADLLQQAFRPLTRGTIQGVRDQRVARLPGRLSLRTAQGTRRAPPRAGPPCEPSQSRRGEARRGEVKRGEAEARRGEARCLRSSLAHASGGSRTAQLPTEPNRTILTDRAVSKRWKSVGNEMKSCDHQGDGLGRGQELVPRVPVS